MRVFKYGISPGESSINIPVGAKILKANFQNDSLFIWALVDEQGNPEERKFIVYGTGQEVKDVEQVFIDTVFYEQFVFHVFEII